MLTQFTALFAESGLITAVFRREVDECAAEGPKLAATHDPGDALELWIQHYAKFIVTKRGLAAASHLGDPAFRDLPAYFQQRLGPVLQGLLDAAVSPPARSAVAATPSTCWVRSRNCAFRQWAPMAAPGLRG